MYKNITITITICSASYDHLFLISGFTHYYNVPRRPYFPHPLVLCCHYPVSRCCSASIVVTGTVRVKAKLDCWTYLTAVDFFVTVIQKSCYFNSYSASHGNWCTATLWNRIMTAQCEGMGEVGSARYEPVLLPPCPSIRVLSYSNCQENHSRQQTGLAV